MAADDVRAVTEDPFAFLIPQQFVLLTTWRKNGTAVPTQVWFAYDAGKLYVTTFNTAGKIKRIRNNRHVTLAACDRRGHLLAGAREVAGQARLLSAAEFDHARAILVRKYKLPFNLISWIGKVRKTSRVYIEIAPEIEQA